MKDNIHFDYIIVGQGLGGTLIIHNLLKRDKSVLVVDNNHHQASSTKAAGVINPITGRKYVKSWMIEDLLPVAKTTYDEMNALFDTKVYHEKYVYRGLYTIKDQNTWDAQKMHPVAGQFIVDEVDASQYEDKIEGVLEYGALKGGMQVNFKSILNAYRDLLTNKGVLLNEAFQFDAFTVDDNELRYKNYTADKVIFSEGYQAMHNPYFSFLPFEPAKGEVLLVKIEGHPFTDILRHKLFIVPIEDNLYWVGSRYIRSFEDDKPTKEEGDRLRQTLDEILKVPYEIIDHIAGIRPCVRGRKPFIGSHQDHKNLYIFNGLGTKGASLGPYWANHLIAHIEDGEELVQPYVF